MKIRKLFNLILILGLLAALGGTSQSALADPRIYYVKATGTGDCLSWGAACKLQTALGLAVSGDEIWTAAGIHYPDVFFPLDRNAAFQLKNGVGIYGGFAGTETVRNQRDWTVNITTLSGNIGNPISTADNSFHVVVSEGNDATAVLNGFIIEAGNANGPSGVEMFGGGMYLKSSRPTLSQLIIRGNRAQQDGGGMYSVDSSPMLTGIELNNNIAVNSGGGMYNLDSNPVLTDVEFSLNTATNGGGMYNLGSSPNLDVVQFNGNIANGDGGGMYNLDSNPTMIEAEFEDNWAWDVGGGMYNETSNSTLTGAVFNNNGAWFGGGGVFNQDCSPTFSEVDFNENYASWFSGGGMYNKFSSPTLLEIDFNENTAVFGGGGIYNEDSNPALEEVDFNGNTATNGGGMYNAGNNPILKKVGFTDNVANFGGGMYNEGSDPTLAEIEFNHNNANTNGGGIYSVDSSLVMANIAFNGNAANTWGGAMFFTNSVATLANARFYANSAGSGGGLYVSNNSHLSVYDATFNANAATAGNGGGIWQEVGSSVSVYNSILWENTAFGGGDEYWGHVGFSINPANPPINLVKGGCIPDNCLNADPNFIDAAVGDLRLQLSSPAVDAGNNSLLPQDLLDLDGDGNTSEALPIDLAGYPRIANGVVDLGAYESPPARIYVDLDATGANNGSSWADAFTDLQSALGWGIDGVEIWVAEGEYLPTADADRTASFELDAEFVLYGGFEGVETDENERDWEAHPTYLSGNVGDPADNADNSYHVVTIEASAVLDGFIITGGNANLGMNNSGGGVWIGSGSPELTNLHFLANFAYYGGGLYSQTANPVLTDCTFTDNGAVLYGGSMYINSGNVEVHRTMFANNRAAQSGGALYSSTGSLTIVNTVFWDNSTHYQGGAVYLLRGELSLINTTFNHNAADNYGAAVFNSSAALSLENTIVWGNETSGAVHDIRGSAVISYSLVENGCPPSAACTHLYTQDPEFVNAAAGNLRLIPDPAVSPAIDVGDNGALPGGVTADLDGNPRIVDLAGGGPVVDLGAYEAQNIAPVAADDSYLTLEDTPLVITDPAEGVLFNDLDANGDVLTAVIDQTTVNGVLLPNADGTFVYTPDPGYTGSDSFSYHASDGSLSSNLATVSITVREVNHAPSAVADSYETERNMPLHVLAVDGVLANDSDPDGDALSAVLDLEPIHGTLTLAADGNFTYVPDEGYAGADHFAYHAEDSALESEMVEVTIEVVNTPPIAMAESYAIDKNQNLVVHDPAEGLLANDEDGNGDPLVVMLEQEPDNGELVMNTDGTFTYIPAVGFSGTDYFAYCASDGADESNMVWVEIEVVNHSPLAVSESYETMANTTLRVLDPAQGLLANDTDPDGDSVRVHFYTEPQGDLLLYTDGTFIYTPMPSFWGTDSFTYFITDLDAISEPIEVNIVVLDDRAKIWLPMTTH